MKPFSKVAYIQKVIVVFILSLVLPQALIAEEPQFSEFEHCVLQEHEGLQQPLEQSSEAAFQIGTCFYQIVDERCGHEVDFGLADHHLRLPSTVSSHIILQYADSWFVLAAKEGHEAATQQLEQTRLKLAELESS